MSATTQQTTNALKPNGEKLHRWYDAGEWWGYKVGVTVYDTGLLVAHFPVGFPGKKMEVRQFDSSELALGYAQVVRTAIEDVMDALADDPYQDAQSVRELLAAPVEENRE